ncbi:MAG: tetratricopeptide repeat protein [Desulfonatronovibrionaceae bacterium]
MLQTRIRNFRFFSGHWAGLLLIVIAGVLVYSNTLEVPFVLDDVRQIEENQDIRSLENFLDWKVLAKNRPLTDFTFALNYHFHGLDVTGYHLVNLVLHLANGVLVYWLVLLFAGAGRRDESQHFSESAAVRLMAFFAALIFVVHPLQTQAVTYIVQRFTIMAAGFYILSVIFYILGRNRLAQGSGLNWKPGAVFFTLSFFSGLLAFLSKQNAASLPGMILACELILYDRTWAGWKRKLKWIAPGCALFILFVLYNVGFFSGSFSMGRALEDVSTLMRETEDISRWEYLMTQFTVLPRYLLLYVFPVGQNIDPMYPVTTDFFNLYTLAGTFFLAILLGAGIYLIPRQPLPALSIFWFFITLSVESSIIPISDPMFEHRMYLPMMGPALATAWVGARVARRHFKLIMAAAICLVLAFGAASYARNSVWQSELSIWQDSVSKNSDNHRAHTSLALVLEETGRRQQALKHYNRALEINPDYGFAHLNLGALLAESGQAVRAEKHFRQALEELPNNPGILSNLGASLAAQGRFKEALEFFGRVLKFEPDNIQARFNLAVTLARLERFDEASEQVLAILARDQDNAQALQLQKFLTNTQQSRE